jgi:hypothetical protein
MTHYSSWKISENKAYPSRISDLLTYFSKNNAYSPLSVKKTILKLFSIYPLLKLGGEIMAKPIIVTLDPMEDRESNNILVKRVDEIYLSGTFRELVNYVLDPEPDEYNMEYNSKEKSLADRIRGWFNEVDGVNSYITLKAINAQDKATEPLDLDTKVNNYSKDIVRIKEENVDNENLPYKCIDLLIKMDMKGAYLDSLIK